MTNERDEEAEVREFRLEGATLVAVAVVIVVALLGAFYLGRRVERRAHPASETAAGTAEDPLAHASTTQEPADVDRSADFFDKTTGEKKQLEPAREVGRGPEAGEASGGGTAAPAEPVAAESGDFFVQVWAGRDRQAAEVMVSRLQREGFPVRIVSDRGESDTLFKVRVGGYPSEARAREMAAELEQKGYRGAWVTSQR